MISHRQKIAMFLTVAGAAAVGMWARSAVPVHHAAASGQIKYVASVSAKPFHFPSCRWAEKIVPGNLESFATRDDAIAAGHVPCKVCKP